MGVTAGIFLASILLKEMRYLVYIRYLCMEPIKSYTYNDYPTDDTVNWFNTNLYESSSISFVYKGQNTLFEIFYIYEFTFSTTIHFYDYIIIHRDVISKTVVQTVWNTLALFKIEPTGYIHHTH